jgi:ABC-type Zn uptake system ZnuABC Zn-binding protein ZnuA
MACNDGAIEEAMVLAEESGIVDAVVADAEPVTADPGAAEILPALQPLTLGEEERLRVVATTSLVADVARRVGGDAVEVTMLMPLGVDPHSYTPTPQDLQSLNDAHLILVNGLGLEETLMPMLEELDTPVPVVSVNAGIAPLIYGAATDETQVASEGEAEAEAEEREHLLDPHTWLTVNNVSLWVENVAAVYAMLDTVHVDTFFSNASLYTEELAALETELREVIDTLPADQRKLVSDHLEFNYFAQEYGFEIVGAALPGISTMSAPSAQELAVLQNAVAEAGVDAIFVGENVDDGVVNQLATDLGIEVVKLYTSSLSEADGPAPDYVTLMRALVNAIVSALQ